MVEYIRKKFLSEKAAMHRREWIRMPMGERSCIGRKGSRAPVRENGWEKQNALSEEKDG